MDPDRRQGKVRGCNKNDVDLQLWQTCELLRTGDDGGVASKRSGPLLRAIERSDYLFDKGIWELDP